MTHAGTLANLAPPTEATLMRRIEELERVQRETGPALMAAIKPMFAEINASVAQVAAQQAYLGSLISRDAVVAPFNTGELVNDATYRLVGPQAVIGNIAIPTGKVRVTISCSEAMINPGSNSALAIICYAIDGVGTIDPAQRYARLYVVGSQVGSSLVRVGTETIPPGNYTIRAQCAYWSAGASPASINFAGLRLLAEVIGAS